MALLNFASITALKIGDVMGDGTMQTTLTTVAGIKEGTASLNVSEPDITNEYIEESELAFATKVGAREADLSVEIIGSSTQVIAGVIGATFTAADASNPEQLAISGTSIVTKACQLEGLNSDGLPILVQLPKTQVTWSIPGSVGKAETRGIGIKFSIQQPTDGSGNNTDAIIIPVGNSTA